MNPLGLKPESFKYEYRNLEFFIDDYKVKFFAMLTAKALPLFLRGGDIISSMPLISGRHEIDIEEVIQWAAKSRHNNFLIDIGANIGLTTCLSGQHFEKVFCFEPNPLAFKILEVNTKIALDSSVELHLHNVALGLEATRLVLYIPKRNWGGAFLLAGNSYDEATLLKKDGLKEFKAENYLKEDVIVVSTRETLGPLLASLKGEGKTQGVIKIDAEGYEIPILREISEVIPEGCGLVVIFENHSGSTKQDEIVRMFGDRSKLYELHHRRVRGAKILRFFKSLLGAQIAITLKPVSENNLRKSNYVLIVNKLV